MRTALGRAAAVGCLLMAGAEAKALARGVDAFQPRDTAAAHLLEAPMMVAPMSPPQPTEAPSVKVVGELLKERAASANTCAYINGIADPDSAVICGTIASCTADPTSSIVACCVGGMCAVQTTCLDRTESGLFTSDYLNTLYCSSSAYPSCAVNLYTDAQFSGYRAYICAGTRTTYFVSAAAVSAVKPTFSSISVSTTQPGPSPSVTPGGTTNPGTNKSDDSGSSNTGAIVGGVVGGVGGIALIGLGLFFLFRKKKNQVPPTTTQPSAASPDTGYAAHQQYQQPPMAQPTPPSQGPSSTGGWYTPGGDNRMSIAKPGGYVTSTYDPSMASSPPNSPPPHSPQPQSMYGFPSGQQYSPQTAPAPAYFPPQEQPQQAIPYQHSGPQQYAPPHHGASQGHASELPVTRGDGQAHELA